MIHTINALSGFHDFACVRLFLEEIKKRTFSEKNKGDEDFFNYKKGGEDFFRANFPKTRPRYLVNFDRSLLVGVVKDFRRGIFRTLDKYL